MKNRGKLKLRMGHVGIMILAAGLLAGCSSTKVARVDPGEAIDLSGRWNDTDSRLVAEEMIKDVLSRPWLNRFSQGHGGRPPIIIVGTVTNRSHEHISVQTFVKDLERELTNDGRVRFVASKAEREEIREERMDQQTHSSSKTAKTPGEESGADFMLKGTINTIVDEAKGTKVVFYQVDLELFNLESNIKDWAGQKKIKKIIERSRFGF